MLFVARVGRPRSPTLLEQHGGGRARGALGDVQQRSAAGRRSRGDRRGRVERRAHVGPRARLLDLRGQAQQRRPRRPGGRRAARPSAARARRSPPGPTSPAGRSRSRCRTTGRAGRPRSASTARRGPAARRRGTAGPTGPGISTTSTSSKIALMRAASAGLPGPRLGELRVGDQRAERRHRLRAPLEPVRVRHAVGVVADARAGSGPRRSGTRPARSRPRCSRDLVAERAQQLAPCRRSRGAARRAASRPRAARRRLRRDRDAQAAERLVRARRRNRRPGPPSAVASRNSAASATWRASGP